MTDGIEKLVEQAVGSDKKFAVTASEKPEFGHYSTNAAFFAKEAPEVLARRIADKGSGFFEKVKVQGKFINFWISKTALIKELASALKPSKFKTKNLKSRINLEFISANPTGPLTMASGRGGFLGDALANVLEAVGHKVTREYYINDAGNQVRLLGESILAALGKIPPKEEHYKGGYIKTLAESLNSKPRILNPKLTTEDIGRVAAKELLKQIKQTIKNAGIKFDVWYSEYENLRKSGVIQKILQLLETKGLTEKKEGATWLKTGDIADEKDRVLVKSDGQPTYFLADLAYHCDKLSKRNFNKAIDIWGADHHGYVARLKAGIKAVGENPAKLKIIITQLIRLVEAGREVKMSKRAGEFIALDDLIKDVGVDAARFFFLLHTPEAHMDFDLSLAKEQSPKNPVYYAQYAFVRCGSILHKAKSKIFNFKFSIFKNFSISKLQILRSESELNLIRELVKFPDVVRQTAEDYQVSRLARYALDVAKATHNFYEKERVIGAPKETEKSRLVLVAATREILGKLFGIVGITKPKEM